MTFKANTRPTWDDYYLMIAKQVATRSKDPSTKVGCVIVGKDNKPLSFGYNGWIAGCNETLMTNERPLKYHMVIHAEMNAILFADRNRLYEATLYCTHGPCHNCLKHALQAGIKRIVFTTPGPMASRGSAEDREAIIRLLHSLPDVECVDVDGNDYKLLLNESNLDK